MIKGYCFKNCTCPRILNFIKIFSLFIIFLGTKAVFAQTVSLLYPNGGEKLQINTSQEIKWSSKDIQNIKIEYSTDNGNVWNVITAAFPAFLGNYSWIVPDMNSGSVIIRIYDVIDNSVADTSNTEFSIGDASFLKSVKLRKNAVNNINPRITASTLTLDSPNPGSDGGIVWTAGTTNPTITWSYSGISTIDIYYSVNGGQDFTFIDNVTAALGSYSWTVPSGTPPTTELIIKIEDHDNSSTYDQNAHYIYVKHLQTFSSSLIKILPVGNSITQDYNSSEFRYAADEISYRYFLWKLLQGGNYNIDFIGHMIGGYNYFPDPRHNGIAGITSSTMLTLLQDGTNNQFGIQVVPNTLDNESYLNAYYPNIVLLHIGTNDDGGNITNVVSTVSSILDNIHTKDSNIWVVIALIINKDPVSTWITNFNAAINTMAQTKIQSGYKILIVNMENALSSSDYVDGTHPTNNGKAIMANLWYQALQLILPSSSQTPTITSTAPTVAYAGLPYRYDVNASGVGAPDYSITSSPISGMSIKTKTGIIDWVPSAGDVGLHTITVRASNSFGNSDQTFTIYVFPSLTLTSNLISYWRMNENVSEHSTSTFKDFPGINDGKSDNSPVSTSGIAGRALSFTSSSLSSNETINVWDDSTFYFNSTQSFSIETWVKTTQTNAAFVGKYRESDQMGYYLGVDGSGHAVFFVRDDNNTYGTATSSSTINDGAWYHVVGVFDRSTGLKIYVDGAVNSTSISYTGVFFSWDPLTIGSYKNTMFFNGQLDEVAMYSKALSSSDITDHYTRGVTYGEGYFDINARIKVFLQGPYAGSGTMNTTLKSSGYLPLSQPYDTSPWNYYGDESVPSVPSNVVDWVLVQLRTSIAASSAVETRAAFLKSNGTIVDLDGSSPVDFIGISPGDYYIVIEHRNHLAVMSSAAVSLPNSSAYDFTASGSAYGTNAEATLSDGNLAMWGGNANGDVNVDYNYDILELWGPNFGLDGYYSGDLNMDGTVDYNNDILELWGPNFGFSSQVP